MKDLNRWLQIVAIARSNAIRGILCDMRDLADKYEHGLISLDEFNDYIKDVMVALRNVSS